MNSMRMGMRFGFLLALTVFLVGCSAPELHVQSMALNRVVHQHRSETMLLNIVRASQGHSMTITGIDNSNVTTSRTVGADFAFPFGPMSSGNYSGTLSTTSGAEPYLSVGVLDMKKEFLTGFQTPVTASTVGHFVDQGWSPVLLAMVMIERLEAPRDLFVSLLTDQDKEELGREGIHDPGSTLSDPVILENQPGNVLFEIFSRDISQAVSLGRVSVVRQPSEEAGEQEKQFLLTPEEAKHFVAAFPGEYVVIQRGDKLQVTKPAVEESVVQVGNERGGYQPKIVFRSPEGMMYYLGELARLSLANKTGPVVHSSKRGEQPLFVLARVPGERTGSELTVAFRGRHFGIPKNGGGRSLDCLRLIQQVIQLQQGDIEPESSQIRVIGSSLR